ncbi:hypothetical protein BCR33DRAFT_719203 [Rhizoclosmatium globosum]|uniref:ABC transporter domain-containing protein n=1 Tax=Rhizoclosmatium globosum TaxID=329046 RepID=A0A1Y2C177_9FUNG|nr:hypothetical protein BCR33DRAFT_719203 [Rhizoclosmatium globosum]|eukprot:ORY40654.1 hypothetical protein BCR33DRAFT_719203 [Rhizoclosmatium globosum]
MDISTTGFDPFTESGLYPTPGAPFNLAPATDPRLAGIPTKAGSGYGCFAAPSLPVGVSFGFSKESNLTSMCPRGFFCPYVRENTTNTLPVLCPPTSQCAVDRLFGVRCLPQGLYEPMLCWNGFYCPDPHTMIPCPEGSFCVSGTTTPSKCRIFGSCPTGSTSEVNASLVLLVALIDTLLLVLLAARYAGFSFPSIAFLKRISPSPSSTSFASSPTSSSVVLVDAFKESNKGNRIHLEFDNLQFKLKEKELVKGVSGMLKPGRMVAVIGPSGAGKTTFLNVLMGKLQKSDGSIHLNGSTDVTLSKLKTLVGYVPQEDILVPEQTVREAVLYSARMRLGRGFDARKLEVFVDAVLDVLQLQDCANTLIGDTHTRGISGGQRKRVNIATELVATPLALFLDEPTSGIDSTTALSMTTTLHTVTRECGVTVLAVLHQPGVALFNTFDDVIMLAPGGRVVYFGEVKGAKRYFEGIGFVVDGEDRGKGKEGEGFLMDVLSGNGRIRDSAPSVTVDELVEMWARRERHREEVDGVKEFEDRERQDTAGSSDTIVNVALTEGESTSSVDELLRLTKRRGAGFLHQVWYSHNRSLLQQSRQLSALLTELGVAMGAGLVIGVASAQTPETFHGILISPFRGLSVPPNDYLVSLYGTLVGISVAVAAGPAGVRLFSEEKLVYWRESAAGYDKLAYYLGKNLSVLARIALTALHFSALYVYFMKPTFSITTQYLLIFMNFFCIYGVSILVSMFARRDIAPLTATLVGLVLALMNGSSPRLIDAQRINAGFLFALSPNRWMTEAQYGLTIEIYEGKYDLPLSVDLFGYELGRTERNLWYILTLGIAYRIIGFGLMVFVNRNRQR